MAPKASKRGGEGKQGLVIALVLFILLTIGLGISTYTGYTADEGKDAKITAAKKELDTMKKNRDWYKFQSLYFQSLIGQTLKPDDQEQFKSMREKYELGADKDFVDAADKPEFEKVIGNVKQLMVMEWDRGKNPEPKKTKFPYEERLKESFTEYEKLNSTIAGLNAQVAKAETRAKVAEDALKTAQGEYAAGLAKFSQGTQEENKNVIANKKELEALNNKLVAERDQFARKNAEQEALAKKSMDAKTVEILELRKQLASKINELAEAKQKGIETPKDWRTDWKITRVINAPGNAAGTVYINLGSADLVKEQLTFSIHGLDTNGKPIPLPKGSLEVMSVLDSHLSQARITSVKDPLKDPIMRDDVLFNGSWNPTVKRHVAITGLIDLTGEGRDSLHEFRRTLERQNIVVDSWLEVRGQEPTVQGPGITVQTDWLIVGDGLDYLAEGNNKEFREKLGKKMEEIMREAKDKGVTVIGLRKYLESIGYRLPRVISDRPVTRPSYPASDTPKDPKKEDKPPMDDKKPDDKKPDDKKPDDKKPDDKKPDDKKPEDKKPDDKNQ